MSHRTHLSRAIGGALAACAIAAPAAFARPADEPASSYYRAPHGEDIRAPDDQVPEQTPPASLPGPATWPSTPQPVPTAVQSAHPRAHDDAAVSGSTIALIAIGGTILLVAGGLVTRARLRNPAPSRRRVNRTRSTPSVIISPQPAETTTW